MLLLILASLLASVACRGKDPGTLLNYGRVDLYYTPGVSKADAERLGQYLATYPSFGAIETLTVQLDRTAEQVIRPGTGAGGGGAPFSYVYELRVVVPTGRRDDRAIVDSVSSLAAAVLNSVFPGKQLRVHMCEEGFSRCVQVE